MKMYRLLTAMLLSFSLSYGLDLMTEDYPPYNYQNENGKLEGISIDIVKEIIKKTGDANNIELLPWARSYKNIQDKKGQVLFVMTRTKERENLFKWVGPVAFNDWVLFASSDSNIHPTSLEDLKKSNYIIGAYKDDACELFLKTNGFKNITSVSDDILNVKKLTNKRIDVWIVGEYQGIIKAKRLGLHNKIKKVFDVQRTELYIAFSKDVPDNVIAIWQKELDVLKANGVYQKIIDKYTK